MRPGCSGTSEIVGDNVRGWQTGPDNDAGFGALDLSGSPVIQPAPIGALTGVSLASDADGTDTVTYSLDDDAGGRFAIDANSGVVTVNGAIDREAAASYDITVLLEHGFQVADPIFDTMIASFLASPGRRNLGLKQLAWERLGIEMTPVQLH